MSAGIDMTRSSGQRARMFLARHWPIVVLVAVAVVYLSTVVLVHGRTMSPIDEWAYLDYISKLYSQGFVREGETYGEWARTLMSCSGQVMYGTLGTACEFAPGPPADYPYFGLTSGSAYPPVQFWIVRVVGDGIALLLGVDPLFGWRLVGVLWFCAALVVIYVILRRFPVSNAAILAIGMVLIASPLAFWSYGWVSTDGPILFFGAMLLWLAIRYLAGEISGWWTVGVAAVGALFKVTVALPVGLVLLVLVTAFILEARRTTWTGIGTRRPDQPHRRSLGLIGFPVLAGVLAVVVPVVWMRFIASIPASADRVDQGISTQLELGNLIPQLWNFLGYTLTTGLQWDSVIPQYLYAPLGWAVVAGVLGAAFLLRRSSPHRALVIGVVLAAFLAAPVMSIAFQLLTGSYFYMPSRYGIGLLPAFLLLVAFVLRNRFVSWLITTYCVGLLGLGIALAWTFGQNYG
ncbi:MAG TPA: hypothetical protein VNQ52_00650 [Microbacteriaceae bacterium]|nr:hypothetical protein [Microbacteriaceae bacterium]